MRPIDADELNMIKFHPLPYTHITPSDVNVESYERGWNDAIDAIMDNAPTIDAVQKWSDDHPEPPKLTREEHDFLASFMYPEELSIRKGGFTMQLDTSYAAGYPNATIPLRKDMFHFIEDDKVWTVEELLKLEVKE